MTTTVKQGVIRKQMAKFVFSNIVFDKNFFMRPPIYCSFAEC